MDNEKLEINRNNLNHRRKRIERIKMFIITFIIIFLLLPTILCLILFSKINSLEKEIKILKVMHDDEYDTYKDSMNSSHKDNIVHAAEKEAVNHATQVNDSKEVSNESLDKESKDKDSVDIKKIENNKKVYLTFDDGPSIYTEKILDILNENQIKATFFVIGKTDSYSKAMYQRIVNEGHTLGMHSYSHQYKNIYNSLENFKKDFNQLSDLLYEVTGVRPNLFRFPGGSSNQVSKVDMSQYIRYLNDKNITYFDWNVVNGDATGEKLTSDKLVKNVLSGVKNKKVSVVLMHDSPTKLNTVNSLPKLIRELKEQEYNILPIDQDTVSVQHVRAESIK